MPGFHPMKNFSWLVLWAASTAATAQPNITRIEYFIDADPGRGNGVSIALNSPSVSILENVPTGSLSEGFHLITVRAQDENNVWGLPESKPFFVSASSTTSSNTIVAMEYFIDADPGRGLGIAIPITPAISLNILENVPTASLSDGFHILTIRAQDQFGQWSLSESRPFFASSSSTTSASNIVAMEYYIDTDPGIGSGVNIPVSSSASLDFLENIPTSSLTEGMHVLHIRAQDQNNEWSLSESKPFFVDQTRQIINYEYAIDVDPGVAMATQVPIAPPLVSIDEVLNIDTNPLSTGNHNLILRVQDNHFFWSKTSVVPFNVCAGANASFSTNVVCLGTSTIFTDLSANVLPGDTYSWDFDGDLVEDDNTVGSTSFTYATSGTFTAMLTIDRSGCPSFFSINVNVDAPATASAGPNLSICEGNPATLTGSIGGSASTVTWSGGAGSFDDVNSLTPVYTHDISEVGIGPVSLTMTTDDPPGACVAASSTVNVNVLPTPTANAGANFAICEGSSASLAGSIGGAASSASWSSSGDGSFDNVNLLNAVYTPGATDIANGAVDLTLTTDDPDGTGPCVAGVGMMTLSIDPAANVNAGNDLTICSTDIATLAGSISPFASNPMWTTTGSGTFSSPASLGSSYTPSAADISAGSVTLTLTADGAGVCPQASDQLLLTIALPITAGNPSIQSNVNQAVNIDVVAASTINVGDVITVSISQNPTKGTAVIQSDNSVDYTASTGTVGADTFQYEICNQCNLCSTGTVTIDILNAPPVVTLPASPFTSVAGQSVTIPFLTLAADINDNIDPASIKIVAGPTSNAAATFDANFNLTIDYSNTPFAGTDEITIEVCDLLDECTQVTLQIEVDGEIRIFNGVSPNADGMNDFFRISNIQFLEPFNKVSIFNRWGDKVFEIDNYNSTDADKRFNGASNNGKALPSGVYFYKVEFSSGRPGLSGYLTLKR